MNRKKPTDYELLKEKFRTPPMEHRSVPFWSWNGLLDQNELDAQIEGFKKQGMGGFMIHVREGLETPYLGDEFIERIKETVATAKKEGVSAWLYDEDRYSSGMGGGRVPRLGGDAVRAKALSLSICRNYEEDDTIQAVYQASILGNELHSCKSIHDWKNPIHLQAGEEVYLVMRRHIASPNEWCHGDTYPDNMNPQSAQLFIETTYECYKEAVGEEFGRTVPGIFTDEPSIRGFQEQLNEPELTWISWSDLLPQAFSDRNGYEIWDTLPYFFFLGPFSSKIRHDYWKIVTEMFCDAYTKQIGNWCGVNGISFAGHFCEEGDIVGAVRHCGAVMPHYRYMDIPGIDTLCEQTDESLTIKQVSSVANQYGKKKVITETYGVTGWGLTFESRKWIGDWQFALGVNFLTHHLALYSLRGCRKRDYPPSFNYHVNWWEHNRVMEDYFARLGGVLSEGTVVRDILVIHPATSVWTKLGQDVCSTEWLNHAGNTEELKEYNRAFNELIQQLLSEHYDFDLGDELILEEIGRVHQDTLLVGQASYQVVVLPGLHNLLRTTYELLITYLDAGGSVLSCGEVPMCIDGEQTHELQSLLGHPRFHRLQTQHELLKELASYAGRTLRLIDHNGQEAVQLMCMRRELSDCTVLFVVNNDRESGCEVEVRIKGSGRLEEWNPLTGESWEKPVQSHNGDIIFQEHFGQADSKLYILSHSGETTLPAEQKWGNSQPLTSLGPVTRFTKTAPNAVVLDSCQYRIIDEPWSEMMSVWQAQQLVRERLQMRQVFANGNLQRHFWIHDSHMNNGTPMTIRFVFHVKDIPVTDTFIVFEQAHRFQFRCNGQFISDKPDGWYLDRSMSKLKLPLLLQGENRLEISCEYTHDMEIEDAFLIGDFALDSNWSLVKEPTSLQFGDWCLQGYPHYCGSMVYHFEFNVNLEEGNRIVLELGPYEAVTLSMTINGQHEQPIPWRPARGVELTGLLTNGINSLDIEVVGSPRNLLGPLHEASPNPTWVDWWSFHPAGQAYSPEYVLRPYGLMGQIHIYQIAPKANT
ncbi:hypothetical protein LOZ80_11225 [Paenibacillus sp. HWE-109]|uniref:glycosyl hydrolase n=1 Tax=Paenibacillus sp. HWE-109 TaxID=1306526 RepID=UPI001EDFA0F7|nr:glycosyl hydrolase [Paenibacillus sp. HWE-109]UKS29463.1 hypothetical protein LOZ80_11225 [Paenibacillus sp. HWE-109]